MSDFLFNVGDEVKAAAEGESLRMLIIGKRVRDDEGTMHDYAGVPYPDGFKGKVAYFEHREIIERVV